MTDVEIEEYIVDGDPIPYETFKSWVAYDQKIRLEELASIGLVVSD